VTPTVSRVALDTGLSYELLSWSPADPACDRTLLLLHGYLDLAWGWLPVVETGLLRDFHVLAPSFRGHGGSDWVGAGATYYFLDYVADLTSLIATQTRRQLCVVGHSMGGMAASYLAGTWPERIERLALLEGLSVFEYPTSPQRLRESVAERSAAHARRGTQAQPGSRRFASIEEATARMRHHDPLLDELTARRLTEHGCVQLPSGEWVFRHDPLLVPKMPIGFELAMAERFWSEVTCDLLYVEGEASPMRLGGDQRARRLGAFGKVRSRRELTIPGAGHMMLRHAADATARALAQFLVP
jgi:pimeloyl-ACP methyl ester carboxylesterase